MNVYVATLVVCAAAVPGYCNGLALTSAEGRVPFFFHRAAGNRWEASGPSARLKFHPGFVEYHSGNGTVRLRFERSNANTVIAGANRTGSLTRLTRVQSSDGIFSSLQYKDLYPGVDLHYIAAGGRLKSEFHIAPHADPGVIRFRYERGQARLENGGSLSVQTRAGSLRESPPEIYQVNGGRTIRIAGRYHVDRSGLVTLRIGAYDRSVPLIIDPELTFSSFWGGSLADSFTSVAVGSDGSIYAAGWTESPDVASQPTVPAGRRGNVDIVVLKLNASGSAVSYATWIGGSNFDRVHGLAVDGSGNVYITGLTYSSDFPVVQAQQKWLRGSPDAFLLKLNAAGSGIVFSTFIGGRGTDCGNAVAVDAAGAAYVAGETTSSDFPAVSAFQPALSGYQDGFIAKFSSSGSLVYSTFLGGNALESVSAIAVEGGNAYVTGWTTSSTFPVKNPVRGVLWGLQDAFVAKLNQTGQLTFSTYLGGSGGSPVAPEAGAAIAVSTNGEPYVLGVTTSTDFPTISAFQTVAGRGGGDVFLTRLNGSGSALLYSTYLSGSSDDQAGGLALDASGVACGTGSTTSWDFPVRNPLQRSHQGYQDAFVSCVSADGRTLLFSTFLGGSGAEVGRAIAFDRQGGVVVAGQTGSGNFPLKRDLKSSPGLIDGFVSQIAGVLSPATPSSVLDLNSDGKTDILWQHPVTGELWVWFLNGATQTGSAPISGPSTWRVPGAADFNGDGKPDILWQNPATGELWVWLMNGTVRTGDAPLSGPTAWRVPAVGDFNGDGKPDILWQNPATGELWVWLMNGTVRTGDAPIGGPTAWRVPAVGDMNSDGKLDILWQHPATGELWVWFMNGTTRTGDAPIGGPTAWRVPAVGDMNSDGKLDILWQHPATGELWVWFMNGTTWTGNAPISGPTAWRVPPLSAP